MFKSTAILLFFLAATITTVAAEDPIPPTSCEPNYWLDTATEPFCKECMCTDASYVLPALCTGTETAAPDCLYGCSSEQFVFTNTTSNVQACVENCPAGFYKDITTYNCVECKKSCDVGYFMSTTCDGTGSSDVTCVACRTGCKLASKFLNGTCDGTGTSDLVCDKCTKKCKAGFYKAAKCELTKDTECLACKTSCEAGYYLKGASRCTGKTNTDPTECKKCQVCQPGTYMSGTVCTGMEKKDTVSCSVCKTSCSKGRKLGGKACTGKTRSDTTVCSNCTPQMACKPGKSVTACVKGTAKLKCSACKRKYNKTKVGLCMKKK
jgi:hypothetical protein